MAPRATKTAKLDLIAHQRLGELQLQLQQHGLPRSVDIPDILSALVMYITAPQLAGMLAEYWRYTAGLNVESAEG